METKCKCPTGKICYSSSKSAMDALWQMRFYGAYWNKRTRTYQCKRCKNWHLTNSKPYTTPNLVEEVVYFKLG